MVAPDIQKGLVHDGEGVELAVIPDKNAKSWREVETRSRDVGEGPRDPEAPQEIPSTDVPPSIVKTHDGVFANMSAKPQIMVLPLEDTPPVQRLGGSNVY